MADIKQIAEKIKGAQNILVALSKNPNVDEVSAALGLTLMLDKLGKKATAIYSGKTPDVLQFLNPEKTFSTDTNALQDFIIALDKDKADHLRYKVDGDYVKVFITPYHEAISENDLEYSYGDFNVDLIIALDVLEEGDLDGALREYGRIMHDAGVVNITTQEGGKFSEEEWSNLKASSVSEMVAELGVELSEEAFEKNSATALLTGIVSSTERFAKENTTPETMGIAAKLMAAGADQRLIAENIERVEAGEEPLPISENETEKQEEKLEEPKEEPVEKSVEEQKEEIAEEPKEGPVEEQKEEIAEEPKEEPEEETTKEITEEPKEEIMETLAGEKPVEEPQKPVLETPSDLMGEMPVAKEPSVELEAEEPKEQAEEPVTEESKEQAEGPTTEEPVVEEPTPEEPVAEGPKEEPENQVEEPAPEEQPKVELSGRAEPATLKSEDTTHKTVKLQPSAEAQAELEEIVKEEPKKNELLDELNKYTGDQAISGGLRPDVGLTNVDTDNVGKTESKNYGEMMAAMLDGDGGMPNPAVQAAPAVAAGPEPNHIPEMDYSQPSTTEAEQPPVMQNGMLEPQSTEAPAGAAREGMMTATEPTEAQAPGMVSAQEGMAEDILPPPPAPPVSDSVMPPTTSPEPAMPAASVEAAAPVEPAVPAMSAAPVQPAVSAQPAPIETPSMAAPVTPVIPAMPAAPAAPAESAQPMQVGPTPTNDDPAAFHIPTMQ